MPQPVVHFEIIGRTPEKLRGYYGELFGWDFDTSGPVSREVSQAGNYGFVDAAGSGDAMDIPGGVGEVGDNQVAARSAIRAHRPLSA